jgi:hypothetical protein
MIEADAGGQAKEALKYALSEAGQGAGSVTLESEEILAGPEDGLDALANGRQVRSLAGFVPAVGPDHACPQILDFSSELPTHVSLVRKEGLSTPAFAAGEEFETHLPLVSLGRSQLKRSGCPVRREDGVQPKPPEIAGVRGTVAIVGRVRKSGAQGRLPAAGALDGSGVDEQEVVGESWASRGKDPQQPFDGIREPPPTLEVSGLAGNLRKQVAQLSASRPKKASVRRDAHDGLGHAQSDDLGIGCPSAGVTGSLWQKIIGRAINDGAEGVEVGVHRGLLVDGVFGTADFGLSAPNPFCAAIFVESII